MHSRYLNTAFADNAPTLHTLHALRDCVVWLSAMGVSVVRMQIKNGCGLIETNGAPTAERQDHSDPNYECAEAFGCQLLWRKETHDEYP